MAEIGRSSTTVTVICRLPSGLVIDLYDREHLKERAKSQTAYSAPTPLKTVRLKGARTDPRFHRKDNILLGMGGRTRVDKDFWDAWCEQNKGFGPLKNGLIFAEASERQAIDALAERHAERTGFEGCTEEQLKQNGVQPLSQDD